MYSDSEKGLPLGNLTSQLLANVLLNELDQFIKHKLRIKYYVRYADDMILIVDGKDNAKIITNIITEYVTNVLKLTIKSNKVVIEKANVITALGFKIYPDKIRLLGRNKRKFKQYVKKRKIDSLNSWLGYMCTSDYITFVLSAIRGTDVLFFGNKFMLREDYEKSDIYGIRYPVTSIVDIEHDKLIKNHVCSTYCII